MIVLTGIARISGIIFAVLLGNWIGGLLRYLLTGNQTQTIYFEYKDLDGTSYKNIPVSTKFYPALLLGLITNRRLYMFLFAGLATGMLFDDRLELSLHRWIYKNLIQKNAKSTRQI